MRMKEETNEHTHRTDYRTDGRSERARGGGNTALGAGRRLHAWQVCNDDFLHGESQSSDLPSFPHGNWFKHAKVARRAGQAP